jgi:hypothetical protein
VLSDAAEKASMNAIEVIQRAGKQTSRKYLAVLGFGICEKAGSTDDSSHSIS